MTTYFAEGSPETVLSPEQIREALAEMLGEFGSARRVLCIPPDFTRAKSQAGIITSMLYELLGERLVDVMPALGTHDSMPDWQIERMFPAVPRSLFRVHHWRKDVETVGEVPGEVVAEATEGIWRRPWPAQLNRLVWHGGHDLILSVGQVVPHEVIGMANHNKNLFVGVGGAEGINASHFLSAAYGMERIMGRADTPLRRILNYAERQFCEHLPIVYVLTVVGEQPDGSLAVRGLFIGRGEECFQKASQLAQKVNITPIDPIPQTVVVHLDEDEYHSTWLGNKAIYRTRMAIADGGELIVLAPGVRTFGEDREIDRLIRKVGYRTTPEILAAVESSAELQANLSAAAHLIHGSSEGRFRITYCPGHLTEDEVRSVGYEFAPLEEMRRTYDPATLRDGWNPLDDDRSFYFIRHPALGLWARKGTFS